MNNTRTRTGRTTRSGAFVLGALLVSLAAACSAAPQVVPLTPSFETRDEAAHAFLSALAARDRATLATMTLSETEFRKYVWPALPASAPDVGMPADYAWRDMWQKNQGIAC